MSNDARIRTLVEAVHEEAVRAGTAAGKLEILRWVAGLIDADVEAAGPYDDTRALAALKVAIADKIREVER